MKPWILGFDSWQLFCMPFREGAAEDESSECTGQDYAWWPTIASISAPFFCAHAIPSSSIKRVKILVMLLHNRCLVKFLLHLWHLDPVTRSWLLCNLRIILYIYPGDLLTRMIDIFSWFMVVSCSSLCNWENLVWQWTQHGRLLWFLLCPAYLSSNQSRKQDSIWPTNNSQLYRLYLFICMKLRNGEPIFVQQDDVLHWCRQYIYIIPRGHQGTNSGRKRESLAIWPFEPRCSIIDA